MGDSPFLFFKINPNDIIGNQYGRIIVDSYHHTERDKWGEIVHFYLCHCTCGNPNQFLVSRNDLFKGRKKSCGCLMNDQYALSGKKPWRDTHGLLHSRFYNIWADVIKRCTNPNCTVYKYYGGRGITFDFKWWTFDGFYREMYESYINHCLEYSEEDTTLDRIDYNKMYCKENCRWATRKEQANNTRRNKRVEYDGNLYTLSEILERYPHHPEVNYHIIHKRVFICGWDIDKALNTPKIEIR